MKADLRCWSKRVVFLLSLSAIMPLLVPVHAREDYITLWNGHIYRREESHYRWSWVFLGESGNFEYMDGTGNLHVYTSSSCGQIQLNGDEDLPVEFVVSNFLYGGTILLAGFDKSGNMQSESINATADGVYATTKRFASLLLAGNTLSGSSPDYDLVIRHEKGGKASGGVDPEPLTVPLMLPNIPLYVRQLLEGLRAAFESRHVKAIVGIGLIMCVGAVIAKWDKGKRKLQF